MDAHILGDSGLTQLASAFGWGVGSSLTPCVYPLIPITLAVFGASAQSSKLKAFSLAVTYVIGMAVTYTALGMFAAKTGAVFGSSLGNPWLVFPIVALLCLLALFSLEVIKFDFAYKLQTKTSNIGGKGYGGAFLMGTVSGLVAAPCVGPPLVAILGVAAASPSIVWGGALLFSYSIGLGLLFILIGTFPSVLKSLPRSGNWLLYVKFLIASALLLVALFLLQRYIPAHQLPVTGLAKPLGLIAVGLACFFIAAEGFKRNVNLLKVLPALALAACAYEGFVAREPAASVESHGLSWQTSIEDAVKNIDRASTKVAMIDLFADWCAACKELDSHTFSNPDVQAELAKLSLGRLDFTDTSSAANVAIAQQYGVVGLPCILFLNEKGEEIADSRITGFLEPAGFIEHLKSLAGKV